MPTVSLEIYLLQEIPQPELREYRVEATGEVFFLAEAPDLTERDVAFAHFDETSLKPRVILHFTPVGMDRLAALSQANIGKRLAVFVEGRFLATPLIQGRITDGRMSLMGFGSPEEARRAAEGLAGR